VLLEGQLGPLVDAAPHAAEPRGEPGRACLAKELLFDDDGSDRRQAQGKYWC
jgi:hypothetical protein